MSKVIITVGVPCSGKSTWARKYQEENDKVVVISRDHTRQMLVNRFISERDIENIITKNHFDLAKDLLNKGYTVILDNTHVRLKYIKEAIKKYQPLADIEFKVFDEPRVILDQRNKERGKETGKYIPANVMGKMWDAFTYTKANFDFKPIEKKNDVNVYTEDLSLPKCVIVDIDGTLAHMDGRSPYEWERVGEDSVDYNIKELVNSLSRDFRIIVFTGRDGVCIKETRNWLVNNNIQFDELYSRLEDNYEKDSVIKKRLFENHIKGKYYCVGVIDDRKQVVDMWRNALGLKCLQVADNNF